MALLLCCTYLIGYGGMSGEGWFHAVTIQRLLALPLSVMAGLAVVAVAGSCLAGRLEAYAKGRSVSPMMLILAALALLAAMYVATYDTLTLIDLYPFVVVLVISLLLFRLETRVVAAVLFGVIVVAFYALSAKELGERDAKRMQFSEISQRELVVTPAVVKYVIGSA